MACTVHCFFLARPRTLTARRPGVRRSAAPLFSFPFPSPPLLLSLPYPLLPPLPSPPPSLYPLVLAPECRKTYSSLLESKNPFFAPSPIRAMFSPSILAPHTPSPPSPRAGCTLSCCCPIRHLLVPAWRARLTVAHWYTTAPPLRYHGTIVVVVWCTLSCIRAPKFDYTVAGDHGTRRSIE